MIDNELPGGTTIFRCRIGCTNVKAITDGPFRVAGFLTDLRAQFKHTCLDNHYAHMNRKCSLESLLISQQLIHMAAPPFQ